MKKAVRFLVALNAFAGATLLYAWGGERPRMRLQRYILSLPDDAGAGLRILHLSDQHFSGDTWVRRSRLRRMQNLLAEQKPDLILMTGDFLHNDAGLDAVEQMLRMLPPARLGRYAVLGNHDYVEYSYRQFFGSAWQAVCSERSPQTRLSTAWRESQRILSLFWNIYRNDRLRFAAIPNNTRELRLLLELYDVHILDNAALALPGLPELWLVGVDDLVEGEPNLDLAMAEIPDSATVILMTHNPDLAYAPPARRAALVLSGHTHGGQVVLPKLGAIHTQGTLLPRDHAAGYFDDLPGGGQMIVSRGMGESTPLRFRCLPEIVIIDLVPHTIQPQIA